MIRSIFYFWSIQSQPYYACFSTSLLIISVILRDAEATHVEREPVPMDFSERMISSLKVDDNLK